MSSQVYEEVLLTRISFIGFAKRAAYSVRIGREGRAFFDSLPDPDRNS
ncbi:hypothetical protein [Paraburkholderia sp. BR14374]